MHDNDLLMAYVVSLKIRAAIMQELYNEGVLQQVHIIRKFSFPQQNVSKTMKDLEGKNLVECLSLNKRGWKPYRITSTGRNIVEEIVKMNQSIQNKVTLIKMGD